MSPFLPRSTMLSMRHFRLSQRWRYIQLNYYVYATFQIITAVTLHLPYSMMWCNVVWWKIITMWIRLYGVISQKTLEYLFVVCLCVKMEAYPNTALWSHLLYAQPQTVFLFQSSYSSERAFYISCTGTLVNPKPPWTPWWQTEFPELN